VPTVPSIKGSVFGGVVEDVNKLLSRGPRAPGARALARALGPRAPRPHHPGVRLGRRTARRLLEAGLYRQLEYLNRTELERATDPNARYEAFGRDLRLLSTISGSILSFSRWTVEPDPKHADRYGIEVSEAHDFPEVLCWRSEGFVNEMASQHGQPDLWRWRRLASDRIVFEMVRPL
jgi:hypothetical protein